MKARHAALLGGLTICAAIAAGLWRGVGSGAAITFAALALLLWAVARFDNRSGAFLVLAVLILLALAALCMLIALILVIHAG